MANPMPLALLRHPGFGLRAGETVPSPVLRFLADRIHAPVAAFAEYARRNQTRLEHACQLHQRLGLRSFARADIRHAVESATAAAWSTDQGGSIAQALMDALRARNIILPSPDTLERVGLAGRAQARRRAAEGLLARVSAEHIARSADVVPELARDIGDLFRLGLP